MKDLEVVSKETLENIKKNNKEPTPNEYKIEFCKLLDFYEIKNSDCNLFRKIIEKLNDEEKEILNKTNSENIEQIIELLLKRTTPKNLKNLASVLRLSLLPSININTIEDFENFSNEISKSPNLLFDRSYQDKMEEIITKRFDLDQSLLKEKTANIAKLIASMGDYLKEAIDTNKNSSYNVVNIKGELQSIDLKKTELRDLSEIQDRLIKAASNIENEIHEVNKRLIGDKKSVSEMQTKINDLEEQLKLAKQEATYDHLTGLLTRRAYDKDIEALDKKFKRDNFEYAIIFFDIDNFKKVNDNYGHKAGDFILKTFAKVLKSQTRDSDILARYGGEEFVATVEYKLKREILQYLKRIKTIIKDNSFNYGNEKIKITFCAGVVLRNGSNDYEEAILKADNLLYDAKNSGRDKIILEDGTVI